jgi:hypothetical protein
MKGIYLKDVSGAGSDETTGVVVSEIGDNKFSVVPFSEDGDPCYKFRLDLVLHNGTQEKQRICIELEWKDVEYQEYRNEVFISRDKDPWESILASLEGEKTVIEHDFLPGKTYITLNPKYDEEDLHGLIRRLEKCDDINLHVMGKTAEGREVHAFSTGKPGLTSDKKILVTARTHPYETAGSFLMEGMIEHGIGQASVHKDHIPGIVFIPMLCPDGVAGGNCKLCEPGGIDLSRSVDESHHLSRVYMDFITEMKPRLFIELHNWMLRDCDGLFYLNAWDTYRLVHRLKRNIPRNIRRPFSLGLKRGIFRLMPLGLKQFAQQRLGTKVMTVEFGWHGRSVDNMRLIGKHLMDCVTPWN